nr:hypothetical protein [uncultured Carboxylicivirga sp.]
MRYVFFILIMVFFAACVKIETDKISDEVNYEPELAFAVGSFSYMVDSVPDFPGPMPPIGDLTPVDIVLSDTLFFSLYDSFKQDTNVIKKAYLHYDFVNRYPANVIMHLYYSNSRRGQNELTPVEGIELKAAKINEEGKVINEAVETSFIDVTDKIGDLLGADQIIIVMEVKELSLSEEIRQNIDNYSIVSSIGVRVKLKFKVDDGSF